MRKTITGIPLKQHHHAVSYRAICSRVPGKWVIVDTEDGNIYGFNEKGWCSVPIEILKAARLAITRSLSWR
jgi:hypothetical protein